MTNLITKVQMEQIELLCKQYSIMYYSINSDGSVNSDSDVFLDDLKLTKLPLKFNNVSGSFYCNQNNLTSLEGSPKHVGGNFICANNMLTSLEYSPLTVGKVFNCCENKLITLKGSTKIINDSFFCNNNKLKTLIGGPHRVKWTFDCRNNPIETLNGAPEYIGRNLDCFSQSYKSLLKSTFSGEVDVEVVGSANFNNCYALPSLIKYNLKHIKLILKYQRHFLIWNDDLSLNEDALLELLDEIEDGLQ